ncbi:hypothetical protein DPMN_146459 [Dreissena polymorpha]|uniref:Pre-mRNA-splicing factor Syf1-like N-terminal HAT-repeats domain-containing protein n=1 Tax=Dreissena polymorpha TaxID=45954 RepID=A0A9D4F730_DREPO|nr:hypothetical protein DPMN_146459 [Dreissena polymorpha]
MQFCCFCSYKLWYHYLKLRRQQVKGKCITEPAFEDVNSAHERSLVFMHKVRRVLDFFAPLERKATMCLLIQCHMVPFCTKRRFVLY